MKAKTADAKRKEEKMAKLKALIEEYNRLHNSFNVEEERYAVDEASFQASEADREYMQNLSDILREKSKRASARFDELHLGSRRRALRLKRIWLDIGNLKGELGAWDTLWYTWWHAS